MIDPRKLARLWPSLWGEILPFLTPHFMRVFNESRVHSIEDATGNEICPIEIDDDVDHMDLVAELAIHAAQIAHERSLQAQEVFSNADLVSCAWEKSQANVNRYEGRPPNLAIIPSDREMQVASELSQTIVTFLHTFDEQIEFSPKIPGSGIVNACEADLSVGHTLIEIKTVNRNFGSVDIRQLFVYLALQAISSNPRWSSAGLFNPRRATWCCFDVEPFVALISGGRTMDNVCEMFLRKFARDVELDSVF